MIYSAAEILVYIKEAVCELYPELKSHNFSPDESLSDLGANSMDRAEIVMSVLERIDLSIPLIDTFGPENIGELALLLSEKCVEA